jgi:hypothetical protein
VHMVGLHHPTLAYIHTYIHTHMHANKHTHTAEGTLCVRLARHHPQLAYIHPHIHTYIHIYTQLKALSAYGWRGTITRKKEDGAVELLANVDTCGLNPVEGIKGIKDPNNVKSYKALETACASKPQKRAFFTQDFSLQAKHEPLHVKQEDQTTSHSATNHHQEGTHRLLEDDDDGIHSGYVHSVYDSDVREEAASQPDSDDTKVYDAPVVQSSSRTTYDYPFRFLPVYGDDPWFARAESQHSNVTKNTNSSEVFPRRWGPDFDWWKVVSFGKGWESTAVPHYKRRQADIAGSLPKTFPDLNFTDPTDEIRYIDPLGSERGYPNLVHRYVCLNIYAVCVTHTHIIYEQILCDLACFPVCGS